MSEDYVKLYKYIPIDDSELRLSRFESIIKKHRVYLSDGNDFNDPFELMVFDSNTSEYSRPKGLKILCLTNSYQNKLMWAHYANSGKGVCITIKVPAYLVYPVCYSRRRVYADSNLNEIVNNGVKRKIKKNLDKPLTSLSDVKKIAYIKDSKWSYENEYRIVFDNDNGLIHDEAKWYLSVKITNVYLGVNFNKNNTKTVKRIKSLCEEQKISIKEMAISDSDYSIRIKRES